MSNALIVKPQPFASVVSSSLAAGHDPAYVGNDHMGVVWRSAGGSDAQSLLVDMGYDVSIDTIALFGCTGATGVWTLTVQAATAAQGSSIPAGSWNGATLPFLAGAAMTATGRGRAVWMAPASPPPPCRYWRITIGGIGIGAAVVARLVMGQKIQLERNFQFGAAFGVRDLSSVDWSARGVLLRRRGKKLRTLGITYGSVFKDEVEAKVKPLIEEIGNSDPVALITDPDPSDQRQNRMYFGPLVGDLNTVWAKPGGFEWRVNLVDLEA